MYNFVIDCSSEELDEFKKITSIEEYQQKAPATVAQILAGNWAWCLQAYINIKRKGIIPVTLSNKYEKQLINLVHSDILINSPGSPTQFIVCAQADYTRRSWTHFHIVQNKSQLDANSSFLPLWVQPGLIGRGTNRVGVQQVAYAGQTFNNNLAGTTSSWQDLLDPYGIKFITIAKDAWHDLREVDVLVGVRTFDLTPYNKKPPSKLINAWHARIPFIGGHDSAYKQIGTPGEDYLLVSTPEETVQAIKSLRDNPELYTKLVRNGEIKAAQYTQEAIVTLWEELLTGPILQRYKRWKSRPRLEAIRFVTMRGIGLQEHRVKKIVKWMMKFAGRR